jgi:hypothetical protein
VVLFISSCPYRFFIFSGGGGAAGGHARSHASSASAHGKERSPAEYDVDAPGEDCLVHAAQMNGCESLRFVTTLTEPQLTYFRVFSDGN